MLIDHIVDFNTFADSRSHSQIRSRLDAVRDNGMPATVEFFYSFDSNFIGTSPANLRPHVVQQSGYVDDFGLPGGIFDNRLAFCFYRRQHDINRGANGYHIQENPFPVQLLIRRPQIHGSVFIGHFCSQHFKAFNM